jgi:transposase
MTSEYVERMEDVLAVYEKPLSPKEPVVCIDERPLQMHDDVRDPIAAKPGKIAKRDSEYKRCGTANAFCAVEPKAGRHFTKITKNRKAPEFAKIVEQIVRSYPRVKTIHLVMDNLNTHCKKSLTGYFGEKVGARIWSKLTPHYTPKHGSWLNQAEIEISMFSRQCLGGDRIADVGKLRDRARAWNKRVNRDQVKIDWQFTRRKAREKFNYKTKASKRARH